MGWRRRQKAKVTRRKRRGLGEPTKKDFVAMADILCRHRASSGLVSDMASHFKAQNPRFDAGRFVAATKSCKR
jgi:hypothetical protein